MPADCATVMFEPVRKLSLRCERMGGRPRLRPISCSRTNCSVRSSSPNTRARTPREGLIEWRTRCAATPSEEELEVARSPFLHRVVWFATAATGWTFAAPRAIHIWRQPLNVSQVVGVKGKLTIWVNGNRYVGNPADIRLRFHEDVQIDAGAPVIGPKTINRPGSAEPTGSRVSLGPGAGPRPRSEVPGGETSC